MTGELQRTKRGLDMATAADLADLMHELSQDKRTRKLVAKAVKELRPDSPHSAAFADVDLGDQFESFRAEQEAKELKRQQDDVLARMNRQRSNLITGGPDGSGRKYAEDDVKKIEEMMQRKGISDYDDGATLYAATLPPMDPDPNREMPLPSGTTWDFPEWGKYAHDPNKAARDTAHTVITEFMRKR
jgi:hypothetical protein